MALCSNTASFCKYYVVTKLVPRFLEAPKYQCSVYAEEAICNLQISSYGPEARLQRSREIGGSFEVGDYTLMVFPT